MAALTGALIAGATALGGAAIASNASNRASTAATNNADATNATNLAIFNQQRNDLAPWRASGEAALSEINRRLGLTPAQTQSAGGGGSVQGSSDTYGFGLPGYNQDVLDSDPNVLAGQGRGGNVLSTPSPTATSGTPDYSGFYNSPGYDFRKKEGERSITASRAASGQLGSGDTLKALTRYGQDYASNEFNTQLGQLMSVAGIGQSATNSGNQLASNYGAQTAQTNQNRTNALASSYSTGATAWGNALNTVGGYALNRWG